jgi:hypothetical protein
MDRETLLREAAEETLLREADSRRFVYTDVFSLVQEGFLTQAVEIDGSTVVFKTLSSAEVQSLILRAGSSGDLVWKHWHIAHSIYMVNGYAVEPQYGSNQAYYLYMEWVRDLRAEIIDVLYAYLVSLRYRLERAIRIVGAFCQERYSRSLWKSIGKPRGDLNIIQRIWVSHNQTEDQQDADIAQWVHTRTIVGSMSSKGYKSLQQSENQWKERQSRHRQKVIEEAMNWVISGERSEQKPLKVEIDGKVYEIPKVHASQTADEMHEEMLRAARGEKDYHDLIVDQYKAFHRKRLADARKERAAALEKAQAARLEGETQLVGYTPEQLAEINPSMNQRPTTQRVSVSPEQERFTQYIEAEVEVGWIGMKGVPEKAEKVAPKPKPTEEDLQSKIARRSPRLKGS